MKLMNEGKILSGEFESSYIDVILIRRYITLQLKT